MRWLFWQVSLLLSQLIKIFFNGQLFILFAIFLFVHTLFYLFNLLNQIVPCLRWLFLEFILIGIPTAKSLVGLFMINQCMRRPNGSKQSYTTFIYSKVWDLKLRKKCDTQFTLSPISREIAQSSPKTQTVAKAYPKLT